MRWLIAILCATRIAFGAEEFDYAAFLRVLKVPQGFSIELVAGAPSIRFPMFACFDDRGRLYVAESSGNDLYAGLQKLTRDCRVSRLDEKFKKATVFQDKVTFPMGIVWRGGRLFLADPPDLVALTDADGDGRAEKRDVILRGFGHTDNGSLHGLTFGPDGMLYFTMGTPDGWKLPRGDGTFFEGVAGALFRCRQDGSGLEVVSRGFENLVEVEFMPGGEIIGTDNWFQQPANGMRDALVDLAAGGLYPYAPDRGTPLPRTGITLPPVVLLPAVAHSGLTRLRLGGYPAAWTEDLFVAEHNTRKVVRHKLRREGSTFASESFDFVVGEHPDFHPSDVLEAPDGSLLIVDTGGWYVEHCPTGKIRDSRAPGGIYRVQWNGPREKPIEVSELSKKSAEIRASSAPAEFLKSKEPAIRRAAAERLAQVGGREDSAALVEALANAADDFEEHACIHALLQLSDEPFVREMLRHESVKVRRAALNILDEPRFSSLRFADLAGPLEFEEEALRVAAIRLLERHPAWASEALPVIKKNPALLVAFQKEPEVRRFVGEALARGEFSLLRHLASFAQPDPQWLEAIEKALETKEWREAAIAAAAEISPARFAPSLARIAEDSNAPKLQRLNAATALREIGPGAFEVAFDALEDEVGSPERMAAEELLARAELAPKQVDALAKAAPGQEAILSNLVRSGSGAVRDLIIQKLNGGWAPSRSFIEEAVAKFPDAAQAIKRKWEENNAAALGRLQQLRPLLTGADVERGKEVFKLAGCVGCHRVGGAGGLAGPDLTKIGAIRSSGDLLESVVFPSSTFAQGYVPHVAVRKDGVEISGSLVSQGADGVRLRDAAGVVRQVRAEELASLKRLDVSLMPAGLDEALTAEQLRDLLGYLQSLR